MLTLTERNSSDDNFGEPSTGCKRRLVAYASAAGGNGQSGIFAWSRPCRRFDGIWNFSKRRWP